MRNLVPGKAVARIVLAAALFVLVACGGKPFEPEQAGDVKSGPGLFTGKKGGVIISPSTN